MSIIGFVKLDAPVEVRANPPLANDSALMISHYWMPLSDPQFFVVVPGSAHASQSVAAANSAAFTLEFDLKSGDTCELIVRQKGAELHREVVSHSGWWTFHAL